MSTSAISVEASDTAPARRRSIALVFCCTVLGAAAQMLMKLGANHLTPGLMGVVSNIPLMCGYTLYGMSTVLLVLALKDGELSLLYPVIALTYVWVTGLAFLIFHDSVNPFKLAGIVIIVIGVAVLGKAGKK